MIRTHWMTSSVAAKAYVRAADYYAATPGRWFGKLREYFGLGEHSTFDQFDALADNLHPVTGEVLRPHAKDGDRIGLDMTFNSAKSVGIARELAGPLNAGDPRIEEAHNEAVDYVLGLVEKDMQCRVRAGGQNDNRTTGNMIAHLQTHRDTRINADDQKPDMSLHTHAFILNVTHDSVEGKLKAIELGQIKHDAPFYEAIYHNRLAANLKALGYGIERKGKAFEIAGVSRELVEKFSRRTAYIEEVAGKLGIVKPESKSKLGATTRLGKAMELADDLNPYYVSRLTEPEKQQLANLQGQPSREVSAAEAVEYAISHVFERESVTEERKLYETAMRRGVGSVTLEALQEEAKRQGVLVKGREVTTKTVYAQEIRVTEFARNGRGTCRPLAAGVSVTKLLSETSLSGEQAVMVSHVLTSPDRVMLVVGDAGTGKTHAVKDAFTRIHRSIEIMAPGAEASRGVLREKEGFATADTVTAFLGSQQRQQDVKNGVIWVDEAGQLPIRDLSRLVDVAKEYNARLVLQGDPKQHRSVARDGNMMRVLESHAGLPVARLKDIRRQQGDYREAVAALADGHLTDGFNALDEKGWVKTVSDNTPLVDAYLEAVETKRADQDITDRVLAIAPTHAEANEVTAAIRERLKQKGLIGTQEQLVENLVPLHWTEAERGDMERYEGTEVLQWHRNGGTFKAGDRLAVAGFRKGMNLGKPSGFAVYRPGVIGLAAGDHIRVTANGWTADRQHRVNNGTIYPVARVEADGSVELANGWKLAPDFKHFIHGYVATSHASQGKTVDRVLIAMGQESLPAISREQLYVSVSRGRKQATIFTDVDKPELVAAVQKADTRKSATELLGGSRRRKEWWIARRSRAAWEALRSRSMSAMPQRQQQREHGHAR